MGDAQKVLEERLSQLEHNLKNQRKYLAEAQRIKDDNEQKVVLLVKNIEDIKRALALMEAASAVAKEHHYG